MKTWLGIFFLSCMSSTLVFGQAVSQISGVIKDPSGAVVPGVEVTATQTDTGIKRSVTTDEAGSYVLPNLPLGPYRLEATKQGFRTYAQTGIELQVGSSPVVPVTLEVGEVTQQVQVEANVVQVEQRSAGVGTVVETQRILDLPLNGRQPYQLLSLSGTAALSVTTMPGDMATGVQIQVAGGYLDGVQYNLDGVSHLNTLSGVGGVLPFPDALEEFKLSTSAQDPSITGHSAATVNAVTKSGTNAFHGDLFEFLRNYDVNARDFFATGQDGLKRNQFGGTIGGPIKKDKLFFFAGYQGTFVRQTPAASSTFVPTAQMLAGDFTTFASAACQNGKGVTLKAPFVNNQVSPALLSPAALKLSSDLPTPINGCGEVLYGIPTSEDDHMVPVRADYQLSDKQSLFARYLLATQNDVVPYELTHNLLASGTQGANDKENALAIGDTYLLSPTMVNSFHLFGNRIAAYTPGCICFGPSALGINMYSYLPDYLQLNVSGAFTVGGNGYDTPQHDTTFGVNEDFAWVHGSHQLAFGASFMRVIEWRLGQAYSGGQFVIAASTGLGLADFETGIVSSLRQQNPNPLNYHQDFPRLYAQDTWKITPKLTLTYGLTWEPFLAPSFQQGDVYNFSLPGFYAGQRSTAIPTAPPGFSFPGDTGFTGKSGVESEWGNFDPRVGLAFDPVGDGKTAIRLGGGISHEFINGQQLVNEETALPFRITDISSGITLDNPYAGGDPFPYNYNSKNPVYPTPGQIPCLKLACPPSFLPIPENFKTPVQYSWNLGVQRQITRSWFLSATYIGTHLIHLTNAVELNPAIYVPGNCAAGQYGLTAPGLCTQAGNITQRRVLNLADPNEPPLGYVTQYDDGTTQSYNGLLVTTRWQMGRQVNLNANYTWSHCIGLGDSLNTAAGQGQQNPGENYTNQGYGQNVYPQNRSLDYGDCYGDRRQIVNITLVYQTPQFSNHLTRILGSDWTLSSTVVTNTGGPLTPITSVSTDPATGFANGQRPNLLLTDTASPTKGQACSSATFCENWLNPAAFSAPALGAYGNLGSFSVRGPGFWEWDQTISRQFQIHEQQRLEVRFEAYNITNSFHPGNPGTTVGSSTFGVITADATPPSATTAPARVLQFAMKYVF